MFEPSDEFPDQVLLGPRGEKLGWLISVDEERRVLVIIVLLVKGEGDDICRRYSRCLLS